MPIARTRLGVCILRGTERREKGLVWMESALPHCIYHFVLSNVHILKKLKYSHPLCRIRETRQCSQRRRDLIWAFVRLHPRHRDLSAHPCRGVEAVQPL